MGRLGTARQRPPLRGHLLALGERFGPLGPLIIAGALVLAVVVGPIPTIPVTIASGILYGPVAGFFWAMIGSLIGAAFAFAIARLAGRPFVERFTGGHIALCCRTAATSCCSG
ncbi:MAG: hypothetical protein U5K33_08465 [Halofilum sp. (in: g-proteobacteria)]|nr:hypothetical protein [Halofilum sp. (in: g-proteobacteria)]